MNNTQNVEPLDWIIQSASESWKEKFKTIHFDCFKEYQEGKLRGIDQLQYSCELLKNVIKCRSNVQDKHIRPSIYFPLGCSKTLQKWKEDRWNDLGKDYEPPSLYILSNEFLFHPIIKEEYRCPVNIPITLEFSATTIFRCFRDMEDIKNNWKEFHFGIDLYREGDF